MEHGLVAGAGRGGNSPGRGFGRQTAGMAESPRAAYAVDDPHHAGATYTLNALDAGYLYAEGGRSRRGRAA